MLEQQLFTRIGWLQNRILQLLLFVSAEIDPLRLLREVSLAQTASHACNGLVH